MVTTPSMRDHAQAVQTALAAALAVFTPAVPVGIGQKPNDLPAATRRWVVVWPTDPYPDGPVADDAADVDYGFQLTTVGLGYEDCEWAADKARAAIRAPGAVTVPGRTVSEVRWTGGSGLQRDRDVTPPVWYRADTYSMFTSPS